jgi:hypothetical protein
MEKIKYPVHEIVELLKIPKNKQMTMSEIQNPKQKNNSF